MGCFFNESLFDPYVREQRLRPARAEAHTYQVAEVDFAHLLWVDLQQEDGILRKVLSASDVDQIKNSLKINHLHVGSRLSSGTKPDYSESMCAVAQAFTSDEASPGHNLGRVVARFRQRTQGSRGAQPGWPELLGAMLDFRPHRLNALLSADFGLSSQILEPTVSMARVGSEEANSLVAGEFLKQYCVDLTEMAQAGRISDVIGRTEELRRLAVVLGRRESNNAILLGEAGVGKTKIVEGLAIRIVRGEVPPRLRDKCILSLDMGLLVAGASYLGQFQDRLKGLLRELEAGGGRFILFIDEIHQLLGLGKTSGAMDAANLMKPALARGELWCIGATTYAEYRHLEADAALRRRFQPIDVPEQSPQEVEEILAKVAPSYQEHHGVLYTSAGLRTLVQMARRYLGDIRSPSREVGLLDELGAELSLECSNVGDRPSVDPQQVEKAIAVRTGIPLERLAGDRLKRIEQLEQRIGQRVVGQRHVIATVAKGIRRSLAGLGHPNRPRAVFFFAGPSGVGKTELAKAIADELYDSPGSMIRLDMSEYNADTARNRLIGSDPGYVGFEEGGRLTEAVRRRPYSLILLDEFEKAHPNVWRLFLQVFDDGRLTDAKGRTVSFAETVIVLTSNVGSLLLSRANELRTRLQTLLMRNDVEQWQPEERLARAEEILRHVVQNIPNPTILGVEILRSQMLRLLHDDPQGPVDSEALLRHALLAVPDFPPELFSRIGRPLAFHPLQEEHLRSILGHWLLDLCQRVALSRDVPLPSGMEERLDWFKLETNENEDMLSMCGRPSDDTPLVTLVLECDLCERLVQAGTDDLIGARALRTVFEETVETTVAEQLLSQQGHRSPIRITLP